MKHMKILGLCLVVVSAYAINVASASATDDLYECLAGPGCGFVAESTNARFFMGKEEASREIKCKLSLLKGEIKTGASSLQVTPTYKECTVFGGSEAKVSLAGPCVWVFQDILDLESEPKDVLHSATALLLGEKMEPCEIEISIPATGCKATIKKQGPLSSLEYLDEKESGAEKYEQMKLTINMTKITYTGGVHCPEEGTKENGIYRETTVISGIYIE